MTLQELNNILIPDRCFAGDCKWRKQGENCVHCSHPDAVMYYPLKKPCHNCGRKPKEETGGCGACIGRGMYVYPYSYDECDCEGYEPKWKRETTIV